jgi:anti-anti-sigma factor
MAIDTQVEEKGDVIVLRVQGRVDAASSPQLEKIINSIIDTGHFKILLNMEKVDYLSSAGMRLMLSMLKKLKQLAGKFAACNLTEDVMDVIKMAGFQNVIEFYTSEEEGLRHFNN